MSNCDKENVDPVVESLVRRSDREYVFVNEQIADRIDQELEARSKKKAKVQVQTLDVNIQSVTEADGVTLPGHNQSVGKTIKVEAFSRFKDYGTTNQTNTVVSLGLNSILDLSLEYGVGQSTLFSGEDWKVLLQKFPATPLQAAPIVPSAAQTSASSASTPASAASISASATSTPVPKVSKKAKKNKSSKKDRDLVLQLARRDLAAGATKAARLLVSKHCTLAPDQEFMMTVLRHLCNLLLHHAYLFDDNIEKTEQDYIIKAWAPILEALFQNTSTD
ncbi:hypothetical protein BC940DRAFT_354526 [Gongronella butleri]|nr:hypothetical protein BC940DRAFT_354526 [Gongronella butleri]